MISGFADTGDGDTVEEYSQVVSLESGVPYSYMIPDSASARKYAKHRRHHLRDDLTSLRSRVRADRWEDPAWPVAQLDRLRRQ